MTQQDVLARLRLKESEYWEKLNNAGRFLVVRCINRVDLGTLTASGVHLHPASTALQGARIDATEREGRRDG